MDILFSILFIISLLILILAGFLHLLFTILRKSYESVPPVPPGPHAGTQDEEALRRNPLFKNVPNLSKKLAWRELGEFPTKVHQVSIPSKKKSGGGTLRFWIKREDLSSGTYGGNKVRTMQYTLASCEKLAKEDPSSQFFVMGSGGSNQVLASMVHGAPLGLRWHVRYPIHDEPDLDNTLNFLSTLSLDPISIKCWTHPFAILWDLMKALLFSSKGNVVIGPGGNSVPGVLGQIGAALELAEQIASGACPDPDAIYLPMGSSCTTTGLIIGICLSRHLGLKAFTSPRFKLVSVAVDGKMALLHRWTNLMTSAASRHISITPLFGIPRVCGFLKEATNGQLDLEEAATRFFHTEWEYVSDADYVGKYGAHSKLSLAAVEGEEKMEVKGELANWQKKEGGSKELKPWLCGHFAAKSFAVLLNRLEEKKDGEHVLLWQTKSQILPRGQKDEWTAFKNIVTGSKTLTKWADEGKAMSKIRQGKVDVSSGKSEDYRGIMTELECNKK